MKDSWYVITPTIADALLKRNTHNRPIDHNRVTRYSRDMMAGRWLDTGVPIIFDKNDVLTDGQHRLRGIIVAGVTLKMRIVEGVDPKVMNVIDTQKPRSATDTLTLAYEKNAVALSVCLRWIERITKGRSAQNTMTNQRFVDMLTEYPSARFWVERYRSFGGGRIFTASFASVLTLAALKHDEEQVERFASECCKGINLAADSPPLVLRNKFTDRKINGYLLSQETGCAFYILAWNAWIQEKPMKLLRYGSRDTFPSIK